MGNIKIIKGVFDTKLELEHAGVAAGFPSPGWKGYFTSQSEEKKAELREKYNFTKY